MGAPWPNALRLERPAEVFCAGAKVLLLGSRVDDTKRGGDIDQYITDIQLGADERFDAKVRFVVELKRKGRFPFPRSSVRPFQ